MKVIFPSAEFDEAVAAVCHGLATEEQMRALNKLLRSDSAARDEYLLRLELHSRLASEPDLFASALPQLDGPGDGARATARFNVHQAEAQENSGVLSVGELMRRERRAPRSRVAVWVAALAACLAVLAVSVWAIWFKLPANNETTTNAVAVLARAVDAAGAAQWQAASATTSESARARRTKRMPCPSTGANAWRGKGRVTTGAHA